MSEATHCYIGTTECGCNVCVVVDYPAHKKDTSKSVARFLRDGLTISRHSIDDFRTKKVPFGRCTHEANQ